jgi:hypothetical protein
MDSTPSCFRPRGKREEYLMSETLWYYTAGVQRIAEILRNVLIFERDGGIAWFTSNKKYQIANKAPQYRIQITTDAVLGSYKELKRLRKLAPIDYIERSDPKQWFGTRQLEFDDEKTPVEKLTSDGWTRLTGPEKQYLRNLPLL